MANPKGNPQNLKPFTVGSDKEVRMLNSKGGKKSQEVQRKKRAEREQAKLLSEYAAEIGNMTLGQLREMGLSLAGVQYLPDDMLVKKAIMLKQMQMSLDGNNQSFEHVRDQTGEKPADKQEVAVAVKSPSDMTRTELEDFLRDSVTERP